MAAQVAPVLEQPQRCTPEPCDRWLRYGYSGLMTRINTTEIWERHGYKVERIEQPMGAPLRNVYGPDGVLLIEDAEYTQETEALRDLGFID